MLALVLGVILLTMKWMEIDPVAAWSWWVVMSPFAIAVAWWSWADASGYTKRKAMEKIEARKQERISRNREAMGVSRGKKRR